MDQARRQSPIRLASQRNGPDASGPHEINNRLPAVGEAVKVVPALVGAEPGGQAQRPAGAEPRGRAQRPVEVAAVAPIPEVAVAHNAHDYDCEHIGSNRLGASRDHRRSR